MGYDLSEILGKYYRMFVVFDYVQFFEYKDFWVKLVKGEFESGEYLCYDKVGNEVWIQVFYNLVIVSNGKVIWVVKYVVDIIVEKMKNVYFFG